MDVPVEITFEQIRERAYELWERHHRPEGFEIELWLMAERELRAERQSASRSPEPTAANRDAGVPPDAGPTSRAAPAPPSSSATTGAGPTGA